MRYRQQPRRKSTSARSTSENPGSSTSSRAALEHLDRLPPGAHLLERPAFARERPHLQLRGAELGELAACLAEELDRLAVAVRLGERLGARQQRLDAGPVVDGDTVEQELRVDPEPLGEPGDRLAGRARLPALDLAHVLLREASAGERGLRQAGGDAQRANARTDAPGRAGAAADRVGGRIAHTVFTQPGRSSSRRPPMG